jgi:hypothetical protein
MLRICYKTGLLEEIGHLGEGIYDGAMKTAPVMPPPRPPSNGNITMGFHEWHGKPGGRFGFLFARYGRMLLKLLVLGLLAVAVGQLGLIVFQTVRLWFFS